MMKQLLFPVLLLAAVVSAPLVSYGDTVIRTGESVSISNDNGVVGDFYAFGNVVSMSGLVEGDFVTAAGSLTTNGEVSGDVLGAGASVDVHGPVGDDVRVMGGEVVIADAVSGDVFVLGGTINILSTASIAGDLVLFGGRAEVAGPVGGEILGRVSELRIDAAVAGDVQVSTGQLALGDNAVIEGTVTYQSPELVDRSPNAVVSGELIRNDSVLVTDDEDDRYTEIGLFSLMLAFSALGWYLISRQSLILVSERAAGFAPRYLFFGLATLFLTPFVSLILLTSMIGSLVGLVLLFSYIVALLLALAASPVIVLRIAAKVLAQRIKKVTPLLVAIGALIICVLLLIPLFGVVILGVVTIVSLGTIVAEGYQKFS